MNEVVKKYFQSALKEKSSFFLNIIFDIVANIISALFIYLFFMLFIQATKILRTELTTNFISINKIVIILLILWVCISGIILTVNYIRIIFIINNNLRERINEENSL